MGEVKKKMEGEKTLVIFDFSNVLFQSMFSGPSLSFKGEFTGGLYGFVRKFSSVVNLCKADSVLVCKDSPPYFRQNRFPKYKAMRVRERDPDRLKDNGDAKRQCEEFLALLGVPVWSYEGLEADDLMAIACDEFCGKFSKIVLVSTDTDLNQLLGKFPPSEVVMCRAKNTLYTLDDFCKEYPEIEVDDWVRLVSMEGGHNGITGLPGIGTKKAMKIICNNEMWDKVYSQNYTTLDFYMDLIFLPDPTVKIDRTKLVELSSISYEEGIVSRFLLKYGIIITKPMHEAFSALTGKWNGK